MKKLFLIFCTCVFFKQFFRLRYLRPKMAQQLLLFFLRLQWKILKEPIEGAIIVLNTNSSDLQVRVSVQNFKFKNSLMEEHF